MERCIGECDLLQALISAGNICDFVNGTGLRFSISNCTLLEATTSHGPLRVENCSLWEFKALIRGTEVHHATYLNLYGKSRF